MYTITVHDKFSVLNRTTYTIMCPDVQYYRYNCDLREAAVVVKLLIERYPDHDFNVQLANMELLEEIMSRR